MQGASRGAGWDAGVVLVLDLGSTWLKGGLSTIDGRLLHIERVASPLRASEPLNAEAVWLDVLNLLLQLRAHAASARILAVSMTGATRSHVFLDQNGHPLGRVMLWHDASGAQQGARVAQAYGLPGDMPGYGAFHPLARALQFGHDHAVMPHRLAELKDWLNYRLTGQLVTDSVAFGRLDPAAGNGITLAHVLARLGLPASLIPPRALPVRMLGEATQEGLNGIPVAVGSFDTWSSCLGMGALRDGGVYDISGTTQVLGLFSRQPRSIKGMVSMPWTDTLWQTGGPCQTGMGTLAWFARTFLDSDEAGHTLVAAQASRAVDLPLCLPYLSGERMPLWSDSLSASFHGVKSHHSRADMAQALVEGLALAHRFALDAMLARKRDVTLYMGGGGAQLPQWVQLRADAFDMPVKVGKSTESALVGAALAAAVAAGLYESIEAARCAIDAGTTRMSPQSARAAYFESRAQAFSLMLSRDPSLS
ncbi:xylulokinase [Allopusillimonas ginsengisoli]|uniref:xylulokinase n=1 Tax=Allopusillimonas ginsengisoli TaxID=453575 RepID=UPI001431A4F2|nr:FGGY-family carbohydrate kinase [Allopusillimonas ginsengisoli]